MKRSSLFFLLLICPTPLVAGEPSPAAGRDPVVLSPFKVVPRGWTVSSMLTYLFWGPVCTTAVNEVDRGSVAAQAGLVAGDQILLINGRPVRGMKSDEMERLLWPDRAATVELEVKSAGTGKTRKVVLRYPEPPRRST